MLFFKQSDWRLKFSINQNAKTIAQRKFYTKNLNRIGPWLGGLDGGQYFRRCGFQSDIGFQINFSFFLLKIVSVSAQTKNKFKEAGVGPLITENEQVVFRNYGVGHRLHSLLYQVPHRTFLLKLNNPNLYPYQAFLYLFT